MTKDLIKMRSALKSCTMGALRGRAGFRLLDSYAEMGKDILNRSVSIGTNASDNTADIPR